MDESVSIYAIRIVDFVAANYYYYQYYQYYHTTHVVCMDGSGLSAIFDNRLLARLFPVMSTCTPLNNSVKRCER